MLPDRHGRGLRDVYRAHVRGDDRARHAPYHGGAGRTKKRRRGGASAGGSTADSYPALVPEDEWEYVVTQYAQAFGQDPWRVDRCEPHGRPELIWYWFYRLDESQRINDLRRELDDFDGAVLTSIAFHEPKGLDDRRKALRAKLAADPTARPSKPKWTREEMQAAAQRIVTSVITTGKLPPKRPVS